MTKHECRFCGALSWQKLLTADNKVICPVCYFDPDVAKDMVLRESKASE